MVLEVDVGVIVSIALAVVAAWWTLAKLFINQFERRQNDRFDNLQLSLAEQKHEIDGHLTRQDIIMADIRRVENQLAQCQVDAANKYQTKDDAGKQFGQLILEIRALGGRIDSLHGRGSGIGNGNGNGCSQ